MSLLRLILLMIIMLPLFGGMSLGQKPDPSMQPTPKVREMRLTRIESITGALSTKHYFYLQEEGFRIHLPGNFSGYVPSKPASATAPGTDGRVSWTVPEAELVIAFGDVDAKVFAALTPEMKQQVLSQSLASIVNKEGTTKISERDLTVNGLPAKEVKFKIGDGEFLARNLFVGSRLFVFVAYPHQPDNAEAIVKQALDTFEEVKN